MIFYFCVISTVKTENVCYNMENLFSAHIRLFVNVYKAEWKAKVLAKDLKSILFPRGLLMEYSSLKAIILEYVSPALVGEYGSYFPPASLFCTQNSEKGFIVEEKKL